MNEEIKEIIARMEFSLSNNDVLINSIKDEFSKVTKVQNEIDGKLESIKQSVNETLKKVRDSFNEEVSNLNMKTDETFNNFNEKTKETIEILEKERLKFAMDMETLINDVNNKTAQVQEFSNGVAQIKERVDSVLEKLEKDWEKDKSEMRKLLKNIDTNNLLDKIQYQDSRFNEAMDRIRKLEKYSHTHTFGGKKI